MGIIKLAAWLFVIWIVWINIGVIMTVMGTIIGLVALPFVLLNK